jgi:3-isopropylmalate/(R)-2-methylmalate dehydratase large subunit
MTPQTAFDKIWSLHIVKELSDGSTLLHIDRHVMHEITSYQGFDGLRRDGRRVRNTELTVAVPDHILSTDPGRTERSFAPGTDFVQTLRKNTREAGIELFDVHDPRQGIVHVMAPELGIALPGATLVCGDSHTCTVGGIGALAFGIGSSQVEHVLATQVLPMKKPKRMRARFEGRLHAGVFAKDLILYLIGKMGAGAGTGFAVEFAGPVIRDLSVEGRLTLCNMSIEMGARIGFVAPDEKTIEYVRGRLFAPSGADWNAAVQQWRRLTSEEGASFDQEVTIDTNQIAPQITWGTSPAHVLNVDQPVPDPKSIPDPQSRRNAERALAYMGLSPGAPLAGLPIQNVFIGSCTNSRLEDLHAAAAMIHDRHVAPGVRAMVVPGSTSVKRAAEAEGLDRVFLDAGFEWRESACSMCGAVNADKVGPGERCVATSNRNFEGRQGPNARTHLASPAMAAAAAIAGKIVDIRMHGGGGAKI